MKSFFVHIAVLLLCVLSTAQALESCPGENTRTQASVAKDDKKPPILCQPKKCEYAGRVNRRDSFEDCLNEFNQLDREKWHWEPGGPKVIQSPNLKCYLTGAPGNSCNLKCYAQQQAPYDEDVEFPDGLACSCDFQLSSCFWDPETGNPTCPLKDSRALDLPGSPYRQGEAFPLEIAIENCNVDTLWQTMGSRHWKRMVSIFKERMVALCAERLTGVCEKACKKEAESADQGMCCVPDANKQPE
jgi:hypothetical protein